MYRRVTDTSKGIESMVQAVKLPETGGLLASSLALQRTRKGLG